MSALDSIITRYQDSGGILSQTLPDYARAELAQLRAELEAYSQICIALNAVDAADVAGAIASLQARIASLEAQLRIYQQREALRQ